MDPIGTLQSSNGDTAARKASGDWSATNQSNKLACGLALYGPFISVILQLTRNDAPYSMATDSSLLPTVIPRRSIEGISAILLPFNKNGEVDWPGFDAHVLRTIKAGLAPAVNMDTGYANLISEDLRTEVLDRTRDLTAGSRFVAGAYVSDHPGDPFSLDVYRSGIDEIQRRGGIPVIFQSFGLTEQPDEPIARSYSQLSVDCDNFIGFELGQMFAPFGKIYSLELYGELMQIKKCMGAKHSSLSRQLEWDRLNLRDRLRPEFKVYTGNDLAIDMVMYGSDYLLGLSTFAPDYFALRDKYWAAGDPRFFELNDLLQYLGCFAFRDPVPAYKHSAAMFLKLRKWIGNDGIHPGAPVRPSSDIDVLAEINFRLQTQFPLNTDRNSRS